VGEHAPVIPATAGRVSVRMIVQASLGRKQWNIIMKLPAHLSSTNKNVFFSKMKEKEVKQVLSGVGTSARARRI
jgi:hypothetical protein